MGNCMVSIFFPQNCMVSISGRVSRELTGDESIMVMRMDGKIMEYTSPLLVSDLTAAYPQHSLVHSGDLCRSLSPDYKLLPGRLYCLLLHPILPSQILSKNYNNQEGVVLSEPKRVDSGSCEGRISRERQENTVPSSVKSVQNSSGIIRVKMVISKKELEALLSDRSIKEKSMENVLLQLQSKVQHVNEDFAVKRCSDVWRPSLESIPEIN